MTGTAALCILIEKKWPNTQSGQKRQHLLSGITRTCPTKTHRKVYINKGFDVFCQHVFHQKSVAKYVDLSSEGTSLTIVTYRTFQK